MAYKFLILDGVVYERTDLLSNVSVFESFVYSHSDERGVRKGDSTISFAMCLLACCCTHT